MLQLLRASASAENSGRHFSLVMTRCWISLNPEFELHCGFCRQIGSTPRPLLGLSLSLFVPFSSPQLCHNIQRTGAHDPGCKHTRGPEVVQQQPRPWDAYELACVWGAALNSHTYNIRNLSSAVTAFHYSAFTCFFSLIHLQEYNPDQASAPPKKKKPDGAPPTPSTDHVAPPGDRSRLVQGIYCLQSHRSTLYLIRKLYFVTNAIVKVTNIYFHQVLILKG